tara:strand:+ start:37 stop:804 length:768 start_codon:yes stop_codon:yes gene_type:complete
MCLIVLSLNPKSDFKLVLTSNRDEFYERPTESMHWWNSSPRVLAGKDKNFDGTWMAFSETGKFAAVTNVREFTSLSTQKRSLEDLESRGDLVKNFVLSNYSSSEYVNKIDCLNYQGFNLILFDGIDALICSNRGFEKKLTNGETYAIGNKPLEHKSKKIRSVEEDFKKILSTEVSGENLFEMMQAPVNKPLEFSEAFTRENHGKEFPYRFIATDIYGTRSTTSIIINKNDEVEITETSFNEVREIVKSKKFNLKI